MRTMKDSGVAWIGEIPINWEVIKLVLLSANESNAMVDGPFGSDMKNEEYVEKGIPIVQLTNIKEYIHNTNELKYITTEKAEQLKRHTAYGGDIVIAKMMPAGRSCILSKKNDKYILSADVIRFKINDKNDQHFILYCLNGYSRIECELVSKGTTRVRISLDIARRLRIAIPTLDTQQRIADYLDSKCAQIDAILEREKAVIEKLKEYKQSVITEAVTKGLNPDVEMKDSGIDWIGKIPKNWIIGKIGYGSIKIGSGKTPTGGSEVYSQQGVLFLRSQNIHDMNLKLDDATFISQNIDNTMKNTRVYKNDVLLNITGGSIGRSCIFNLDVHANVNQHVCIIRVNKSFFSDKYMCYFWISSCGHNAINVFQSGANREGMNFEQISKTSIPIPSIAEQNTIADYLDKKCAKIDRRIETKQTVIDKLTEYKKSLIYEVVTGKKEV